MKELVDALNEIFEKYKVTEKEVAGIQDLISKIENDNEGEFTYGQIELDKNENEEDED